MIPIRVLLVEDSPVSLLVLKRIFSSVPEIEVVGTASNGLEALKLMPKFQPDVICTDYHMAPMNGLEFTREVMQKYPRPILVFSASVQAHHTQNVFQLLEAGAVDVFPKPTGGATSDYEWLRQELIAKIKILAGVKVFTRHRKSTPAEPGRVESPKTSQPPLVNPQIPGGSPKEIKVTPTIPRPERVSGPRLIKIIGIGASTGGPQALHTILSQLPAHFPVPVICVQHISEGFLGGLVEWLAQESKLPVKIAGSGELPQAGIIYFPPERRHLELDPQGRFLYSAAAPVSGHRPSVTVTFNSLARVYGRGTATVLLTGMGKDGAEGTLAVAQVGGMTIAQDEGSCVVFGMPKEAIALGAVQHILPVNEIAPLLLRKIGYPV